MPTSDRRFEPRRACHGLALALGWLLAACTGEVATHPTPDTPDGSGKEQEAMTGADQSGTEAARVPAGAIQVNRRLYMVPVGVDADGCEQFTPFSPGGMTNQAIHYRMPDGRFELSKDVTACRVEMVALGPDDDGCERFQAKPAGGLPPTDVAYYRTADGGYVAHKDRAACPAQR